MVDFYKPGNNNSLTSYSQSAVGILLDCRNTATTSKTNVICATNILKW